MSQILLSSYPSVFPNTKSLLLDGSTQYATLPGAAVDVNAAFTIEAWLKIAADGLNSIFSALNGGSDYWIFIARNDGDGLCFQKQADPEDPTGVFICSGATTIAVADGWCHAAVTFDGVDQWKIVKMGVAVKTQTYAPTGVLPLVNQQIGAVNAGAPLNGRIDEVRVWDVARTPTQIAGNMYRNLSPGSEPNLVGYWRWENTPDDETSNNDATLVGSPAYSADTPYA